MMIRLVLLRLDFGRLVERADELVSNNEPLICCQIHQNFDEIYYEKLSVNGSITSFNGPTRVRARH